MENLEREGASIVNMWHKRKDSTVFPATITKSFIRDETGSPVGSVVIARDITEQKEKEEELKKAKIDADAASQAKILHQADLLESVWGGYAHPIPRLSFKPNSSFMANQWIARIETKYCFFANAPLLWGAGKTAPETI